MSVCLALAFVAAAAAGAPAERGRAAAPLEIAVRFEIAGLPLPAGTTFPRLPAGLPVALVPVLSRGGEPLSRAEAAAEGLTLRWLRLDAAEPVTSNLHRVPAGSSPRIAATALRTNGTPIDVDDPWRLDADRLVRVGTVRFQVRVDRPGDPGVASTPGPQVQLELAPGIAGGLSPEVLGLSRRSGEDLGGVADELAGIPFLFSPLGEPPAHQTEARIGTDCTSTFVYALRRLGVDLPYHGPRSIWPDMEIRARDLHAGADGVYRDARGAVVATDAHLRPGDLLHFGTQLSMWVQDRWPFGVLDIHDVLLQAWRSSPSRVPLRDSGYAGETAAVVRFRTDLARGPGTRVARAEDSHAGAFYHLRAAVEAGADTLVVLDAHDDAAPNPLAAELAQHEASEEWIRGLRARGVVQPTDWIDALLPRGLARVRWIGPWEDTERVAAERAARERLCVLAKRFPERGFACRAATFEASTVESVLELPADAPTVVSIDLDYLLRADGTVSGARANDIRRVLAHFGALRGVSVSLSRAWFPEDARFERALLLLSSALQASGRIDTLEVDLAEVQQDDRSLRAVALRAAGRAVPRPRPEQIEATPGLRLVAGPRHATFGLLGDVYLADAADAWPEALPYDARPPWQPPERVPLLANLETPVADDLPVQGYPTFNRHGDLLDALARQGVVIVSAANNHALDQGRDGLHATVSAARGRGLGVVGAWLPGEVAAGVERLRIGDLRVAVLGVTSHLNREAVGDLELDLVPFETYPQTAETRAAEARYLEKVRRAAEGADVVVVLAHGGTEWSPGPSVGQQRFFRALAAAGATVVAGAHAHVPSGHAWVNGSLLVWGLGDVVPRGRARGAALRVTAERLGSDITVRALDAAE